MQEIHLRHHSLAIDLIFLHFRHDCANRNDSALWDGIPINDGSSCRVLNSTDISGLIIKQKIIVTENFEKKQGCSRGIWRKARRQLRSRCDPTTWNGHCLIQSHR